MSWVAIAAGPRVGRLVVAQVLGVLLVYGLATRLVDPLLRGLINERSGRFAALALVVVLLLLLARHARERLFPVTLGALRRQPLSSRALCLAWLPWSLLMLWPVPLIIGLGHASIVVVAATALISGAGALLVLSGGEQNSLGSALSTRVRRLVRRSGWSCALFGVLVLIELFPAIAVWLAAATMLAFMSVYAPDLRFALRSTSSDMPDLMASKRITSTSPRWMKLLRHWPITALWQRDVLVLFGRPRWLVAAWWPVIGLVFLLAIGPLGNGNCEGDCPGRAALFLAASTLLICRAAIGTLCDGQGIRLFVPERFVSTRHRLAALAGVLLVVQLPFIVTALLYSRDASVLLMSGLVVSTTLLQQCVDPTRAVQRGWR